MDNDLKIYAKGEAFIDGTYNLRILEAFLSNYRKIFDRLICLQLGKRQLPRALKSQIDYEVQINSGSIELAINFILEHKELIAIIVAQESPSIAKSIIDLLSNALELRKIAAELLKKGINVKINIVNSFNIGVNGNNSNVSLDQSKNVIQITDPKILWAAQSTRAPLNDLLASVDGSDVEYIDMTASTSNVRLTKHDKEIIGSQKELLPTTLNIVGRLDMVAFTSHRGVIVSDGKRYNVTWAKEIRNKMQKIADADGIIFNVKPVIDHKKLDNDAIGFHILDCKDPQGKFF